MKYKCPNPSCPSTDFEPIISTTMGDDATMAICQGECGGEYPVAAFKRVR